MADKEIISTFVANIVHKMKKHLNKQQILEHFARMEAIQQDIKKCIQNRIPLSSLEGNGVKLCEIINIK